MAGRGRPKGAKNKPKKQVSDHVQDQLKVHANDNPESPYYDGKENIQCNAGIPKEPICCDENYESRRRIATRKEALDMTRINVNELIKFMSDKPSCRGQLKKAIKHIEEAIRLYD